MTNIERPPTPPALRWGAATDTGRARPANEDNYAAGPMLFVVADGMGGHAAGEVASEMAIDVLYERLAEGASSVGVVVAAAIEANAAIFHESHSHPDRRGMGTTITGLVVLRPSTGDTDQLPIIDEHTQPPADGAGRLAIVNVGDSRTYVMRHGHLRRMTTDHSYVQELLATGHITEAEARSHPRRNIVTRGLGIDPTVRVDSWVVPMVRDDRFVMCSDGLVDEVDDQTIATIIAANEHPQDCAQALIDAANEAGGRDNITVVVLDVLDGQEAPAYDQEPPLDLDAPTWMEDGPDDDSPIEPRPLAPTGTSGRSGAAGRPPGRGGLTPGKFLFGLAVAAIVTITTVFALAALNDDDPPPTTTSTTTSTTVGSTTSTSSTTSTTRATTTVPGGQVIDGTTPAAGLGTGGVTPPGSTGSP